MNRVVLYTSIFGPYDELKEVPAQTITHDARCYTDQDLSSVTWQIARRELTFDHDTMRTSRYYKINPAISDYEFCVYLDGSFQIIRADFIQFMLENLTDHQMVLFKHPWRDCLYDEADVCLTRPKYNHKSLRRQIKKYASQHMPRHFGLWACGSFAFRNNHRVSQFSNAWWGELEGTSTMDQISFPYVVRKLRFEKHLRTIDQDIYDNQYLRYVGHKMEYVARQRLITRSSARHVRWCRSLMTQSPAGRIA